MKRKISVGILFGGKSAEHEVSLQSARSILSAIDRKKYAVVLIGIDKKGQWYRCEPSRFLRHADNPSRIKLSGQVDRVALVPGKRFSKLVSLSGRYRPRRIDAVFPVLHGPFGEDGTVQGLMKIADVPFVGAGVLGSAVAMDKDVMKRLLRDAGVPVAKFLVCHRHKRNNIEFNYLKKALGLPMFIKPANLGSSVGISKILSRKEFNTALEDAFEYDDKVLFEECIAGREIECSVLGNENRVASLPGEIIPRHEFYSYEAKYLDGEGAILKIPAELPSRIVRKVQAFSVKACEVLCCEGMARVDMFLRGGSEVLVNEINTIPGFTKISMYPKLWEVSGMAYSDLIDRLIELALARFEKEKRLETTRL